MGVQTAMATRTYSETINEIIEWVGLDEMSDIMCWEKWDEFIKADMFLSRLFAEHPQLLEETRPTQAESPAYLRRMLADDFSLDQQVIRDIVEKTVRIARMLYFTSLAFDPDYEENKDDPQYHLFERDTSWMR